MRVRGLHWTEYAIEALCLGTFMVSACAFGTLFEHPSSPVRQAIENPLLRRIPMGLAMGLTAILPIYSRIGQRSGAHMNPATTLTFFRLGKVAPRDAVGYVVAQLVILTVSNTPRAARYTGLCAKLHHPKRGPCIFACQFGEASRQKARARATA